MLTRVGIKVNLLAQTKSKYFGKILLQAGNQTSMYMLGWTPSSTDAHNALLNLAGCRDAKTASGQFNLGGYCNKKVDELITQIGTETDQAKRNAMIKGSLRHRARRVRLPAAAPAAHVLGREGQHQGHPARRRRARPARRRAA